MGAVTIKLPADDYRKVLSKQLSLNDLFKDLLFNKANHHNILTQLQNYHSDEDGAPIVPEFDIASTHFDATNHTGKIQLSYKVDFTFACADRRATTKHIETSNFTFDFAGETLTLFIHDKISRDTFEEF